MTCFVLIIAMLRLNHAYQLASRFVAHAGKMYSANKIFLNLRGIVLSFRG